jgi:dipeptidyl aminopeptidase/acylaminoacyl peptidase
VVDLAAMCASDMTQNWEHELGGAPWAAPAERAAVTRFDPASHSGGWLTPTLIVHGEKDYRVPIDQGLELYGMLKARGVPARLLYFSDENHFVRKPTNSLIWYDEFHAWLRRYMGEPGAR